VVIQHDTNVAVPSPGGRNRFLSASRPSDVSIPRTLVERLGRPEYTGENRCLPCTVLNAAIAVGAAALLSRRSRPAGGAALLAALGLIYLRGYLVPGTPTLTRRYLPESVLAAFGKRPVEGDVPAEMRQVAAARMDEPVVSDDE